MKLKITIVPAKILIDGTHRIRIGMSHNGTTRYFVTRFIVNDPKCVRGGMVGGIPNASYINQQLMKQMSDIYAIYDTLENTDYLSCSQLLQTIQDKLKGDRPVTIAEAWEQYISFQKAHVAPKTLKLWQSGAKRMLEFFKEDFILRKITPSVVNDYITFLSKSGVSVSTQSMYLQPFRQMITYAKRQNLVTYEQHPFKGVRMPKPKVRAIAISMEELRRIRDFKFTGRAEFCRDVFMLSFFLCGMNLIDILRLDLTKQSVRFLRKKTESRRSMVDATEFTIQPEARAILDRIYRNGTLYYGKKPMAIGQIQNLFTPCEKTIKEVCRVEGDLIYYSARKTFAQLANELMIKDSIIEYCLGDAVSNKQKVIGSYISVNRRMADKAIRKVFDAVASEKSLDELIDEGFAI